MPQASENSEAVYSARLEKLREAMKEFGVRAVVLEPGPAMVYLTGVHWGRSERTFAVVIPEKGSVAFVLPGFEEMRARELIRDAAEVRIWQEDESPFQQITDVLKERGINTGRVAIDPTARFFVFDGIKRLAPKLDYVTAQQVLKSAGVK